MEKHWVINLLTLHIIIFIVVFIRMTIPASAQFNPMMVFSGAIEEGCTSCTGGLLFAAYFEENSGLDITDGDPCGCAANSGDTIWTANDSCVIVEGANGYVDAADAGKYVYTDISGDDVLDDLVGSGIIKFYVTTLVDYGQIWSAYKDDDNRIVLYVYGDELYLWYEGNNTSVSISTSTAETLANGNAYYALFRYTASDVNPNLYIAGYNSSKELIDESTTDTNLTQMSSVCDQLRWGNGHASADADFHIYGGHIYDSYAGASTDDFSELD